MMDSADAVAALIAGELAQSRPREDLAPFVSLFQSRFGPALEAVILYGSKISSVTEGQRSIHDFIVIIESWRPVSLPLRVRIATVFLPPTSFSVTAEGRPGKLIAATVSEVEGACRPGTRDLYLPGRLGKRVMLLWARSPRTAPWLAATMAMGLRSLRPLVLAFLPERFTREEYIIESLRISYRGEWRVERPGKVMELFGAAEGYYDGLYGALLDEVVEAGEVYRQGEAYIRVRPAEGGRGRLVSSKVRGVGRWPKHVVTVESWLDIMAAKLERSTGRSIVLTPWERRHPIIASVPHFFRLVRGRLIR